MGGSKSKHSEEIIVNTNAAAGSTATSISSRHLSDVELIIAVLIILLIVYLVFKKIKTFVKKKTTKG